MGLTSVGFLIFLVVLTAGLVALAMVLWDRWPRLFRMPLRLVSILALMLMGVVIAGDQANRMYDFYESFGDLVAADPGQAKTVAMPKRNVVLSAQVEQQGERAAAQGHGITVNWSLPGPKSKINRNGMIYLPAAYFDQKRPNLQFPVLEAFHGYTGSPNSWFHELGLASQLDTEIAAGRVPPMIAVVPKDYGTRDNECINATHGDQDETYLAEDVPADVAARFRTLPDPTGWATIGFSMGGFCAVNLALHHPERYGAAASLSGYFHAVQDKWTGNIYHGDKTQQSYNSPVQYVQSHRQSVALYLFGTARDQTTRAEVDAMRRAYRTPGLLTAVLESTGGHTGPTWQHAETPALDWVGEHMSGPLVPGLNEPGSVVLSTQPPASGGPTPTPSAGQPTGGGELARSSPNPHESSEPRARGGTGTPHPSPSHH